jgi:hypothetical protein
MVIMMVIVTAMVKEVQVMMLAIVVVVVLEMVLVLEMYLNPNCQHTVMKIFCKRCAKPKIRTFSTSLYIRPTNITKIHAVIGTFLLIAEGLNSL